MLKGLAIGLGSAIIIAAIVVCAIPLKTVSYTVTVPYEETETYYETHTETYVEREPYNKAVPVDYIVTDKGIYGWFWSTGSDVWVNIRNTDVKSGTFSVRFDLTLHGGAKATKHASKYIALGDTEEVQVKYSGGYVSSFTYSITAPTKTVIDYRDVQKTREITIPKQRTVTKHRQETRYKDVTILEYLTNYQ